MDASSLSWKFPRRWLQFQLSHLLLATFLIAVACWWLFHVPRGVQRTGRDLDLTIFGRGYFICTHPSTNATAYTRCGRLSINSEGMLCVGGEWLLEPNITIPPEFTSIAVTADGNFCYYTQGQEQASSAGQLNLATFINTEGLREVLPDFFEQTDDSGQPQWSTPGVAGTGLLQQGYLETPAGRQVEMTTLLLLGLCGVVGWLAWEVRCLRVSLAAGPSARRTVT